MTIENGVLYGSLIVFTNIYNPKAKTCEMDQVCPTIMKKGATIGANSTIICDLTLGRYCFISAGAAVNSNVLDYALIVENPAKQIG